MVPDEDEYEGQTQDPRCPEEGCDGVGSHLCIVRALREENARLKAEVERLREVHRTFRDAAEAEVERLKDTQRKFGVVQHELSKAVELALDLFETGLVDFKKYGLKQDSDIANFYRAALRGGGEHSKHPTGDHCVYCRSQWPCEESGGE